MRRTTAVVASAGLLGGALAAGLSPSAATPPTSPPATAQLAAPAGGAKVTAATFAKPPQHVRPKMRWWLPLGPMDDDTLRTEVADIAAAGFSGVEILGTPTGDADDLEQHGFGTPSWNHAMDVVLAEAEEQGISVDFTATASYPPAVPMDADHQATAKDLVYGQAEVAGGETFSDQLPESTIAPRNGVTKQELVAVTAARVVEGADPSAKPLRLQESTTVDLTDQAEDGRLTWTAPGGGTWVLLAWWQRADGHQVGGVTAPPSYTVDHLSRLGVDKLTEFWDETLLTPEVRDKLAETGGDIFEDSLHLDQNILWTPELLAEFEERRGYDLTPYLPAITIMRLNTFFNFFGPGAGTITTASPAELDFEGLTGERVRNDYYQTLTDLYVENHLVPLREWAHDHGLRLRVQPSYGQSLEITAPALEVDVPETESFQLGNLVDGFRTQAAAVHMGDKPVYSTECCATPGRAHSFTWEETLAQLHLNFAGGVNQAVFHGYPHQDGPGAIWPGWYHFGNASFSENYGAQPSWTHMPEVTDFIAREQMVLRTGTPKVDVAIYRHSYWDYGKPGRTIPGKPKYYNDDNLERGGFSYEFLTPRLLRLPNAEVAKGRLDPEGPAYKALVLDNQRDMPVGTARKVLQLAKKGLPVVVVGAAPSRTPFYAEPAKQDAKVRKLSDRLLDRPNVLQVRDTGAVAGALARLRVRAAADNAGATSLLNVHRRAGNTDYYWFLNPGTSRESAQVALEGRGRPYVLDAWSGEVEQLGHYQARGGRVSTEVSLAPGETTIIAVTRGKRLGGSAGAPSVETAPTPVGYDGDQLVARISEPGRYVYRLQNGTRRSKSVDRVPEVAGPASWHLEVEDWKPGASPDQTVVENHELELSTLQPWSEIPELQDVSGVGTYTTTVELSETWGRRHGAVLDLGTVFDTVALRVNGTRVAVDMANPVADVSEHLVPGTNTLEVRVATTLRNRMRTVEGSGQAASARQPYGLVGPVSLRPYVERTLKRSR